MAQRLQKLAENHRALLACVRGFSVLGGPLTILVFTLGKKFKAHVLQRIKQASRGLAPFDYLFIENTLPTEIKYYPQSG